MTTPPDVSTRGGLRPLLVACLIAGVVLATTGAAHSTPSTSSMQIGTPSPVPSPTPPGLTEVPLPAVPIASAETVLTFGAADGGMMVAADAAGELLTDPIPVPITPNAPYVDVGTLWLADGTALGGDGVSVSVRGSSDGVDWNAWFDYDHFHYTETGALFGHLASFPAGTRYVQFRVMWNRERGEPFTLRSLRVVFIDPGRTPDSLVSEMTSATGDERGLILTQALPVVSRTGWGCPTGQSAPEWPPSYSQVTHLIVHHTVSPNFEADYPARVRSIWEYHTNFLGWGDIGYNFLIDPNGVIYEGRAGGDGAVAAHFSCFNSRTMGVALLGTFTSQAPTNAAVTALENLLAWKATTFGINPVGQTYHPGSALVLNNISGHRDGNPSIYGCPSGTSCPGNALYALLPAVRNVVDALVPDSTATPTRTPTPTFTPTPSATPTPSPTPTNTPPGFENTFVSEQALLAALQTADDGAPVRVILVILRDGGFDVYLNAGGVDGRVGVTIRQGWNVVALAYGPYTNPQGGPAPEAFIAGANAELPGILTRALDALMDERYGPGFDVQELTVLTESRQMMIGVMRP